MLEDMGDLIHSVVKDLDFNWTLTSQHVEAVGRSESWRVQELLAFFNQILVCQIDSADFVVPAITFIINSVVADYILTPFCADIQDQSFQKGLTTLLDQINCTGQSPTNACGHSANQRAFTESQEKAGRWRAMTFHALRAPNNDHISAIVETGITWHLYHFFAALALSVDGETHEKYQLHVSKNRVATLVEAALKLHDAAQGEYVSVNYQAFLPQVGDPALAEEVYVDVEAEQELSQAGQWRSTNISTPDAVVMIPTCMGLRASRKDSRGVVSEVVHKAKVVLMPGVTGTQ